MDLIIGFFRDVLDGPLYIVVTIICVILICSCIGYLAEQSLNKKKKQQEYEATHATVSATENVSPQQIMNQNIATQQVPQNQPIEMPVPQPIDPTAELAQPVNQQVPSTIGMPTEQITAQPAVPEIPPQQQPMPQVLNQNIGYTESQPTIPNNQG